MLDRAPLITGRAVYSVMAHPAMGPVQAASDAAFVVSGASQSVARGDAGQTARRAAGFAPSLRDILLADAPRHVSAVNVNTLIEVMTTAERRAIRDATPAERPQTLAAVLAMIEHFEEDRIPVSRPELFDEAQKILLGLLQKHRIHPSALGRMAATLAQQPHTLLAVRQMQQMVRDLVGGRWRGQDVVRIAQEMGKLQQHYGACLAGIDLYGLLSAVAEGNDGAASELTFVIEMAKRGILLRSIRRGFGERVKLCDFRSAGTSKDPVILYEVKGVCLHPADIRRTVSIRTHEASVQLSQSARLFQARGLQMQATDVVLFVPKKLHRLVPGWSVREKGLVRRRTVLTHDQALIAGLGFAEQMRLFRQVSQQVADVIRKG